MAKEGEKGKAYVAVVVIQFIYAGYFLLTKLAFDVGMNTFVFVFYRQALATLFLAPTAFFFQRKTAPRLSLSIFIKIFMLSFIGISLSLNIVGVALKHTSASLGAATSNALPVMTFFLALLLRMESLKIRTRAGMMKGGGVILCIGGVAAIAFYRGPSINLLMHHHLIHLHNTAALHAPPATTAWIKGVFLLLLSLLTWTCWIVLQGRVLKIYPSKLLLTTWQCFLSTLQCLAIAAAFARDPSQWKLGWNLRLASVAYCGIVVTGVTFYMQAWVIEKKGPVFLAMTTPLILVFTIIFSALLLGEIVSFGSVLGAMLLVGGLYFVLWGKMREEQTAEVDECVQPNIDDAEKGSCAKPKAKQDHTLGS